MKKDLMYGNSRGQLQLKKSGVSRGVVSSVQEKLIWNFHRSKFLILEFPRQGISHNILEFPGVKSCFLMGFWEVKVQKVYVNLAILNSPACLDFFLNQNSPIQTGENRFILLIEWFLQFQSRETLGCSRTEKNPNMRVVDILFWT